MYTMTPCHNETYHKALSCFSGKNCIHCVRCEASVCCPSITNVFPLLVLPSGAHPYEFSVSNLRAVKRRHLRIVVVKNEITQAPLVYRQSSIFTSSHLNLHITLPGLHCQECLKSRTRFEHMSVLAPRCLVNLRSAQHKERTCCHEKTNCSLLTLSGDIIR